MKNLPVIIGSLALMLAACGNDKEPSGTEEGDTRQCGSGVCLGTQTYHDGGWTSCDTNGSSCGECCVCQSGDDIFDCGACYDRDGDSYATWQCDDGFDCDDGNADVYPGSPDMCDGVDNDCDGYMDEDERVVACGDEYCAGERQCLSGWFTPCTTEGMDCGPCCRCDGEGNHTAICETCEDGESQTCGSGDCYSSRVCSGDTWSECLSSGADCGHCCECDENGNPLETCTVCDEGEMQECGESPCRGVQFCIGDGYSACSTAGLDCGRCCVCDQFGFPYTECTTCESGESQVCGSGECRGYEQCVGDSWGHCDSLGRDCGECCRCDENGNPASVCATCEDGAAEICGAGECVGVRVCSADTWSDCSTAGNDCGTCCRCSATGSVVYDDAQDADCPDYICPAYAGCGTLWTLCGETFGSHTYASIASHEVGGACTGLAACGHDSCYDGWTVCEPDADNDNYSASCGDCNDSDSLVSPGYPEQCDDFVDNDCDGSVDEGCCPDRDFDGYRDASCGGNDCLDSHAGVHPGASEICDGFDNDCDGSADNLPQGYFSVATLYYVIPPPCDSDFSCCYHVNHREPGLIATVPITGLDFAAINPAYIYVNADSNFLYYAKVIAWSDATIDYRVNLSGAPQLSWSFNFRTPQHFGECSAIPSSTFSNQLHAWTIAGANYPTSVEFWVSDAGDYGAAIKDMSVRVTMACY